MTDNGKENLIICVSTPDEEMAINQDKDDELSNLHEQNTVYYSSNDQSDSDSSFGGNHTCSSEHDIKRNLKRKNSEDADPGLQKAKYLKAESDAACLSKTNEEFSFENLQKHEINLANNVEKEAEIKDDGGENNENQQYLDKKGDLASGLQDDKKNHHSIIKEDEISVQYDTVGPWNETFIENSKIGENSLETDWDTEETNSVGFLIKDLVSTTKVEIISDVALIRNLTEVRSTINNTISKVVSDTSEDADDSPEVEHNLTLPEPNIESRTETRHRKLYRLLREGEDIKRGLEAKNPNNGSISVVSHVAYGSNGNSSKYISTCTNTYDVTRLRNLKMKRRRYKNGTRSIVEIDVDKLPLNVEIIDLTEVHTRQTYEAGHGSVAVDRFRKYANEYSEVLLVGKVPPECLKIY